MSSAMRADGQRASLGRRLLRGEVSYDYVGRRKFWYALSASLILLSLAALLLRGLNFGIDFRGGTEMIVSEANCSVAQARDAAATTGFVTEPRVQTIAGTDIRLQTGELTAEQSRQLEQTLAQTCGVTADQVSPNVVGPSWGADVSNKALRGLVAFLVLVSIFLSFYFEWKMALAAMLALIHDLVITAGIYSLVGFEVSPSTVIGLLTVLGYSLYDTVVVFDKVKENTTGIAGTSRSTYSEATNLAVNQTLLRSINTTIIGLLPIAGLLFVGAGLLGAGTLKDLALVLFVGLAAGAYSSIFIATPFLAQLKEREPGMRALAKRVAARRASGASAPATPAGATALDALPANPRRRRPPAAGAGPTRATATLTPALETPTDQDDPGQRDDRDEPPGSAASDGRASTRPAPTSPTGRQRPQPGRSGSTSVGGRRTGGRRRR